MCLLCVLWVNFWTLWQIIFIWSRCLQTIKTKPMQNTPRVCSLSLKSSQQRCSDTGGVLSPQCSGSRVAFLGIQKGRFTVCVFVPLKLAWWNRWLKFLLVQFLLFTLQYVSTPCFLTVLVGAKTSSVLFSSAILLHWTQPHNTLVYICMQSLFSTRCTLHPSHMLHLYADAHYGVFYLP